MVSRPVPAVLLVMLSIALAACGQRAAGPAALPAPAAGTAAAPGGFGPTERAFVELSIATGDMAVRLLDLGVARTASPALREVAREVGTARRAELTELRGLLSGAALGYVNIHAGHDMPGMPTEAELVALGAAGPDFDAVFAALLRAHLEESGQVVRSALGSVTHEPTRAAAQRMERERAAALGRLAGIG